MSAAEKISSYQSWRKTPSFSSSLLDAICRSLDDRDAIRGNAADGTYFYQPTANARSKQSTSHGNLEEEDIPGLRRSILVEKWMDVNPSDSSPNSRYFCSNSSSSGSSSRTTTFSSSETESANHVRICIPVNRNTYRSTSKSAKQSETSVLSLPQIYTKTDQTKKREGKFMRTTKTAVTIYGDLKKARHPNSPGNRISKFLNSLFSSRNLKKSKVEEKLNSIKRSRSLKDSSTARSDSIAASPSFSRSCLSKTPPLRGDRSKRCVRFYPLSIILDEDSRPCGQKSIFERDLSFPPQSKSEQLGFVEKATGRRSNIWKNQAKNANKYGETFYRDDYDDDFDDVESCSSSDLFDLETGAHGEELPVFETTDLRRNQAIANGLIL